MTTEVPTAPAAAVDGERVAMARTAARLAKHVELALATADLSPPQYRLLSYLSHGGELASVLAGQLDVSRPTITALVDGLVARGYVERIPHPDDRRCIRHVITDEGSDVLAAGDAALARHLDEIADLMPAASARRAASGLRAWSVGLDAYHERLTAEGRAARR